MTKYSFLLITLATLWSCGDKNNTQTRENEPATNTETPTTPAQVDSVAIMKPQIEQILTNYYADLGAENIDENKYFAPIVSPFFASQNVPAAKIGESLRQGFKTMDHRKVTIDPAHTLVSKTMTGYEVEFMGTSEYTEVKTKKQVKSEFHNKVVFDNHLKINGFAKAESGERGLNVEEETEMVFAEKVLASLNSANAIEQFMDSEKGTLYMYREGIFDHIVSGNTLASLKKSHNSIDKELKHLGCKTLEMKAITFDCDKEFSAKGCFLSPVNDYHDFSKKAEAINKVKGGLRNYTSQEMTAQQAMETLVTHTLIVTDKYLLLGLGKVNGKWRVITIDTSKFDCSA